MQDLVEVATKANEVAWAGMHAVGLLEMGAFQELGTGLVPVKLQTEICTLIEDSCLSLAHAPRIFH